MKELEQKTITSLEVADMIGKEHKNILRDIRGYSEELGKLKIEPSDFFAESTYLSEQNKQLPCTWLQRKVASLLLIPLLCIEESRITSAVRKKGVHCLGGKESSAYQDKSLRGKVYSDIYGQLKREFGVDTYKAIKRSQCDLAIKIIEDYELPMILKEEIEDMNAQMVMQ